MLDIPVGLPPSAVEALQQAARAIQGSAEQAARAILEPKVLRGVRYNNRNTDPGYRPGIAHVLATVGMDDTLLEEEETTHTCGECGGEYDRDESHCCEDMSCCGYCASCESHHGGSSENTVQVYCRRGNDHTWCNDCEHTCE